MASKVFAELSADSRRAHALVRPAHARRLCAGHFPGDPIVPGALLAGLMADLAARLLLTEGPGAGLAELVRCVFLARVRPDQEIVLVATRNGKGHVDVEVSADRRRAARATFRFTTPA